MRRNSNEMSNGMAIILTLGILIFIGWIMSLGTSKCIKSGCDHDAKEGSSSTRNTNRSTNYYDDGYNDVYEDDDYDWDRYRSDSDYAAGVDDAMEDEDW